MTVITKYSPALKPDILALMNCDSFKSEIWDWQFSNWRSFAPIVVKKGDDVVGFNGVMPVFVWDGHTAQDAIWSCDFYVSENSRGHGLGKLIKKELLKRSPKIVMSLGISDAAMHVLLDLGWKQNDSVRVFRKRKLSRLSELPHVCLQWVNQLRHRNEVSASTVELKLSNELANTSVLDEVWNENRAEYGSCIVRDGRYLKWRYGEHPLANYNYAYAVLDGRIRAWLVYTVFQGHLTLVDYMGPRHNVMFKCSILDGIIKQYPQEIHHYSFTVSDNTWTNVLLSMGFYQSKSRERFVILDQSNNNSVNQDWYITSGDSDGELLKSARQVFDQEK